MNLNKDSVCHQSRTSYCFLLSQRNVLGIPQFKKKIFYTFKVQNLNSSKIKKAEEYVSIDTLLVFLPSVENRKFESIHDIYTIEFIKH